MKNKKHLAGYLTGVIISAVIVLGLLHPANTKLHAHGPMNVGHEKLKCGECHKEATGTLRQQLQANTNYLFGFRDNTVTIGYEKVSNKECLNCHDRKTDTHPVYRFVEPKFAKVRAVIQPQVCTSCHNEHSAMRVTIDNLFCQHCHSKLSIKEDVLSTTHEDLVKQKRWDTCLGCHDYHGNHLMKVNEDIDGMLSDETVQEYFKGAESPYSKNKKYKARDAS